MTAYTKQDAAVAGGRFTSRRTGRPRWARAGMALGSLVLASSVACKDSNIPFYNSPTSVENSPDGIQNAVTGLIAASRQDVPNYIFYMTQFARDEANIQEDNPQNTLYGLGLDAIPTSQDVAWDNVYLSIGAAINVITAVPNVVPAYTAPQAAAVIGIAQTIEALDLMILAETRDTLGIPVHAASAGGVGPVYCNKDVWIQIVAELDSANNQLQTAGSIPLPVKLPAGFSSVNTVAGPSTTPGSFAAFNRALAAKAGLELAYAIARSSAGTAPTPTTPGSPDVTALTRADSAATASALYTPTSLSPEPTAGWLDSPDGVFWDWSAQAGDVVNPLNSAQGVWVTLRTLVADVDTINDLRWKAKFGPNPFGLQLAQYDSVTVRTLYNAYATTATPIPIIRAEGLVLAEAQIQLGLGNFANAITLVNDVHQQVGGFATPLTIAANYTAVRDSLMKEQRISLAFEASNDRTVTIRMYNLEATADTTYHAQDLHTTIIPVPSAEVQGRGGQYTITCPSLP
jgi:starch-binding outer membrane protein, SusD/RagB family